MSYIVVTGAAGFIGSCLVNKLNNKGITNIIVVDDFSSPAKNMNLVHKSITKKVNRDSFLLWLDDHSFEIESIFHLGARTDTAESDYSVFEKLNLNFSKQVWEACVNYEIPLIYASSAATYGLGEHGYVENMSLVPRLKPLNPYGISKNEFDKWVLQQNAYPPFWAGMKFFNVYGPNEYHKNRMASVVFHSFRQIQSTGKVQLFRSHRPDYLDGMQLRDFIYVKDVIDVLYSLMQRKPASGIFNLGTGKARSFLHLAQAVFKVLGKSEHIEFIDTPLDIRDKYQYFTQADMTKLREVGEYEFPFYSLEEGIYEYVEEFLSVGKYF
jgi:ADP-L-glycero-D-manno-heptose 6-epimerase